jgi:hypothetical protein
MCRAIALMKSSAGPGANFSPGALVLVSPVLMIFMEAPEIV